MRKGAFLGVAALAALLAFGSATASAQVINKCQAGKKKCVIKKVKGLLGCHATAEGKGIPVESSCLLKQSQKFDGNQRVPPDPTKGCIQKLQAKGGCLTPDETAEMEAKIDTFVLDVVQELDPGYPVPLLNKCSSGKKKCVSKKVVGLLRCHVKAETKGALDPNCILKQKQKFDGNQLVPPDPTKGCIQKLQAEGGCLTPDETAAMEGKIDAFVDDVVCELDPSEGTCPTTTPTPTPTFTPSATPTPTTCLTALEFTPNASDPQSELDSGWLGFTHDLPFISDATLTVAVTGCANASKPCGVCTFAGPIPNTNAGAGVIDNRRCSNDTTIACTSDALCAASHCVGGANAGASCTAHSQCPGSSCSGSGACRYFWGSNLPVVGGSFALCLLQEIEGPVSGTADIEGGAIVRDMSVREHVFVSGGPLDTPCPVCTGDGAPNDGVAGGSCSGGDRNGLACDANGVSPWFGTTSLDCPPSAQIGVSSAPSHIVSSTGSQSLTLSAASPACTDVGSGSFRCACNTCNSASWLPCATNGDCPDPPGPIGPICGGKQCGAGANTGAACTTTSECPGSSCGHPGWGTRPNDCTDATCTSLGGNEGYCAAGPVDNVCAAPEQYRGCVPADQTTDCPITHTCTTQNRACFLDNGVVGGSIAVTGATDAPVDSFSQPTLGAVYCAPPTSSTWVNVALGGVPGPVRLRLRETVKAIP